MERRVYLSGHKPVHRTDAVHMHTGSQTQNADLNNPVVSPTKFMENRNYYIAKWGGRPTEERFDTPYNSKTYTYKNWIGENNV